MAETLKNIIEVQEQESLYQETIKSRIKSIKTFKDFGPPDLCYLTKEYQKSLSFSKQPSKMGFYHYVYGLDASSPASVSAHLKRLLQMQEKEKTWFSSGRWKITKGIFCIYDAVSKIDIHVEIGIPGGMKLYGYKGDESLVSVDEPLWERGYISSILRYIRREPSKVFKIYEILATKEHLMSFLETFTAFHLKNRNFCYTFDSSADKNLDFLGNKPLYIIVEYLINRRLMEIAKKFLEKMIDFDPKTIVFMSHLQENMGRLPEAIQNLAKGLSRHPHTIIFLFKQAQLLLNFRKIDLALELAKIVVQLNPESFESWLLLTNCYYEKKNYPMVLLTMNSTPILNPKAQIQGNSPHETKPDSHGFTNPEEKNVTNIYDISFAPHSKNIKFTRFSEELILAHQEYLEENERTQQKLEHLACLKLEPQELKLYEFLVKIESDLGWDKVLSLRGELFFMESDGNCLDYFTKNLEDYVIDYSDQTDNVKQEQEPNKINDSSDEDQEHQLPSFLQNDEDNDEQIKKLKIKLNVINKETNKTLNLWDQRRSKKITELSNETFETEGPAQQIKPNDENLPKIPEIIEENKGDQKEKSEENKEIEEEKQEPQIIPKNIKKENESNNVMKNKEALNTKFQSKKNIEKTSKPLDIIVSKTQEPGTEGMIKRLCSKTMDTLFLSLFEDLNTYYEWEAEEGFEKEKQKAPKQGEDLSMPQFNGIIWILRGMLAERLFKEQAAEIAYRKSVETGFNLFAWYRLIKLYGSKKSCKAVMVCVGEVLEEFEHDGLKINESLPRWIEEIVLDCIAEIGIKKFYELLKELNLINDEINKLVREAENWKITFKN